MYDCPYGSTGSATGSDDHWCAGSPVEVMSPLANGPFRGILVPANVNTHGCEDVVRSVGSWYLPRLTTAPVLGRPTRRWLSIRRGSPITPPGLAQHRELNLDGPPQRSHFNRSNLGVHNTSKPASNLLLTDPLCSPFKTRGFTLAVGPL